MTRRASLADALKAARGWRPANAAATSLVRLATRGTPPAWAVEHLPRTGTVRLELPGVAPVRMWSGDDWLTSRVWWRGIDGFEPEAVRPFLHFAATARGVLDVGAYTGYYALLAAAANPAARVLAFEPNPTVAARLGANLALNPSLRVTVLPYAIGDRPGRALLHLGGPGLASSSSLSPRWEGRHESVPVAVTTLDAVVHEWGLEHVDIVKIDVESREPSVVAGMESLIATHRPVIFTEVLGGADDDYMQMADALRLAGYRFFRLLHDGTTQEEQGLRGQQREAGRRRAVNHLLCPVERTDDWLRAGHDR